MNNKRKYPSRQVRRAAARIKAKQSAQKERAQRGNQKREETQEPDKSKRKIDWKFAVDTALKLVLILVNIFNSCG